MLINKYTLKWIESYCSRPSAALLLTTGGDTEMGQEIIKLMHSLIVKDSSSPLIFCNSKDDKIGIDDIRELQKNLKLQANKSLGISRIAVIENVNEISNEAQTSLLKILEELPSRTIICLIAKNTESLLSTILSRCFQVRILPVERLSAMKWADQHGYDQSDANTAYTLSEGSSTLFRHLLTDKYNLQEKYIADAKLYLGSSVFVRQVVAQKLARNPTDALTMLQALQIVTRAAMRNASSAESKLKWGQRLMAVLEARDALNRNCSLKLCILNLSMKL